MLLAFSVAAALAAAAAYLVRLGVVVRSDRSTSIPRSHHDPFDSASRPAHW